MDGGEPTDGMRDGVMGDGVMGATWRLRVCNLGAMRKRAASPRLAVRIGGHWQCGDEAPAGGREPGLSPVRLLGLNVCDRIAWQREATACGARRG